jgi:hypothetical protein
MRRYIPENLTVIMIDGLYGFAQSLPENSRIIHILCHERFFPDPSQFILYLLLYYLALYGPAVDIVVTPPQMKLKLKAVSPRNM